MQFTTLGRTQVASSLFLQHNTALAPPYRVIIDTNFINFSLQNKLELMSGMMDCLYAKCEQSALSTLSGVTDYPATCNATRFYSYHWRLSDRYSVCNRLCAGWIGEIGTSLSYCSTVGSFILITRSTTWLFPVAMPFLLPQTMLT